MKSEAEIEEGWKREVKDMPIEKLVDWFKKRKCLSPVWRKLVATEYNKRVKERVLFT